MIIYLFEYETKEIPIPKSIGKLFQSFLVEINYFTNTLRTISSNEFSPKVRSDKRRLTVDYFVRFSLTLYLHICLFVYVYKHRYEYSCSYNPACLVFICKSLVCIYRAGANLFLFIFSFHAYTDKRM